MLTDRYAAVLRGVISCFYRVLVQGTLPEIAHAQAMTRYLNAHKIRIFDFTQWAQPARERLRAHTERVAEEHGITIEFIRHIEAFRKEDRVQAIVAARARIRGSRTSSARWRAARRSSRGTTRARARRT